jgi:hypothetical protein
MQLLLLPGMDGTGQLFTPLLTALPPTLSAVAFSYPPDEPLGYEELLPLIESAAPHGNFVVVGESVSFRQACVECLMNLASVTGFSGTYVRLRHGWAEAAGVGGGSLAGGNAV